MNWEPIASGAGSDLDSRPDIWELLVANGLLGPCLSKWFKLSVNMRIMPCTALFVAVAFLYLALFPESTMSNTYGKNIAQTFCAALSVGSVFDAVECIGASRVLHSEVLRKIIQPNGNEATTFGLLGNNDRKVTWWCWRVMASAAWLGAFLKMVHIWSGVSLICGIGAVAAAIFRGNVYLVCPYVRNLAERQSMALLQQFRKKIDAFPVADSHPDAHFWKQAIEDYKELDTKLECLWKEMMLCIAAYFCNRFIFSICALIIFIKAEQTKDCVIQGCAIVCLVLAVHGMLSSLYGLAGITDSCNSRSISSKSIFATTVRKLGKNQMTEQQEKDHLTFIRCLEISPTGVQMGVLVDSDCVVRVGAPVLTGLASVLSYALATLHIEPHL